MKQESGKRNDNAPLSALGKVWLSSPWRTRAPEGHIHLQSVPFILAKPLLLRLSLSGGLFALARSHFRLRFRADWSVTSRVYVNVCDEKVPHLSSGVPLCSPQEQDSVVCVYRHYWGNVIVFQKCCLKKIKGTPCMSGIQMYVGHEDTGNA